MTTEVFHGVPIPKRMGGRATEGLYSKLTDLSVNGMLFVADGTSRSTSATVARVAKTLGRKFTSRKVAREPCLLNGAAFGDSDHRIVPSGTQHAIEGIGIWRVA